MIGVAFALHETFGIAPGIEALVFERVVHEFAAQRRLGFDATAVERMARADGASFGSPVALSEAFAAAFAPSLLSAEDVRWLEALFRMSAASAVAERFVPFEDVAPALRGLAELRVPRIALGGGWAPIDQRKADLAGFDGSIIFAEDLGVAASSPAAFARVAEVLLLPADRIWFVASNAQSEIVPAAAAGLRTIWVNRGASVFPPGLVQPDATIGSLLELFDVLREPYTRGLLALRHILRTALEWRPGHFIPVDDDPATGER